MDPDPTPRIPWSSDRPKVPPKAKRMEMCQWQNSKKEKDMGERDKQNNHAYDKVTAKKNGREENTVAQRKALER